MNRHRLITKEELEMNAKGLISPNDYNIPDFLSGDDIIYHFTKFDTAICKILNKKRLRFSDRKKSYDPIESKRALISRSLSGILPEYQKILENDVEKLANYITKTVNDCKQLCFCLNNMELFNPFKNLPISLSYYGFLKSRMWDQYADRYQGVCIAFSKSGIEKLSENKFYFDKIKYLELNKLKNYIISIVGSEILEIGAEKHLKNVEKIVQQQFCLKHTDYEGECEWRVLSLQENKNDEDTFIDFELNDVKALFYSKNCIQKYDLIELREFSMQNKIPLYEIDWENSRLEDHKKTDTLVKMLNEKLKKDESF